MFNNRKYIVYEIGLHDTILTMKLIFFFVNGTTLTYAVGEYLKYSKFIKNFFDKEINVGERWKLYEAVNYSFTPGDGGVIA